MRVNYKLLMAMMVVVAISGCPDDDNAVDVCTYDGESYATGDSFPSTDGCNTCSCTEDGTVACTAMGCDEETTDYCEDACTLWAECWDYDTCMGECTADKDWDKSYLDCLENAEGCEGLEACDEETTGYCEDACTLWAECWDYDTCMGECTADNEWDKSYLDCLETAEGCEGLEACG